MATRLRSIEDIYLADAGASDTYAVDASPAPAAYAAGQMFLLEANTANTGACTLNVNGLGAQDIKTASGADPANDDILTTSIALLVYNGTNMILLNPATTCD